MPIAPLVLIAAVLLLSGCSDREAAERAKRDHVWKSQTRAIEKARGAEEEIRKAFERRDREMEQQSH